MPTLAKSPPTAAVRALSAHVRSVLADSVPVRSEDEVAKFWAHAPADWRSSTVDTNRLLEVLAFIEMHPDRWDQTHYACGTLGCIAGWTVALHRETDIALIPIVLSTDVLRVPELAQELLGLTYRQARFIFGFLGVHDPVAGFRHPTFEELVDRVRVVTGVDFRARHPEAIAPVIPFAVPELTGVAA